MAYSCRSVVEFLEQLLPLAKNTHTESELWYRGTRDGALSVSPGLYWRDQARHEENLVTSYLSMAPQFDESRHLPLHATSQTAQWEWYFSMQHYGLPTRLLDWSENPLVALYFAVRREAPPAPAVWVLNPARLNERTLEAKYIIVPGGDYSKHWLPESLAGLCVPGKTEPLEPTGSLTNGPPIAIYPVRRNRRIVAQQGVFTVHGADPTPLDSITGVAADGASAVGKELVKIEIDPGCAEEVRRDLDLIQINELALFPELPNVTTHLKRIYKIDE